MNRQEEGASGQRISKRQFLSMLGLTGAAAVAVGAAASQTPAAEAARGALEEGVVRVSGTIDDLRNFILGIRAETAAANGGKGKDAGGEKKQEGGSLDEDLRQAIEAGSGDPESTIAKVVRILGVGVTKILAPHLHRFDGVGKDLGAVIYPDLDYFVDTGEAVQSNDGFLVGFRVQKRPNQWITFSGGVFEGQEMFRVIELTLPTQEGQVEMRTLLSIGSVDEGF